MSNKDLWSMMQSSCIDVSKVCHLATCQINFQLELLSMIHRQDIDQFLPLFPASGHIILRAASQSCFPYSPLSFELRARASFLTEFVSSSFLLAFFNSVLNETELKLEPLSQFWFKS